jgi:CRP/FNR family transcriptional regulator, cyclic AMP receptor protein
MTRLQNWATLADAIGATAPFSTWPREALIRLAESSIVSSHLNGTALISHGQRNDSVPVVLEGTVLATVSNPAGRRVTFKIDNQAYAYGLLSLVDGQVEQFDLVSDGPVTIVRIPHVAIRAELTQRPELWQSVAIDLSRRSRSYLAQLQQFVFDPPLVRAAALLLGLMARKGEGGEQGPVAIELRLSQDRFAEMLSTSRQWATVLVRELIAAGLIEWRYGRVTVLDPKGLRAVAAGGISAWADRSR